MSRQEEIKRVIIAELRRQNATDDREHFEYLGFDEKEDRATIDTGALNLNELAAAIDNWLSDRIRAA